MMIPRLGAWTIMSASILLTAACATDDGYSSPSSGRGGAVAAGSVEDSLSACMSRIPSDASEGQRMIAEQSCARDQTNRK